MKKTILVLLLALLMPVAAWAWTLPVPSGLTAGEQVYALDGSTLGSRGSVVVNCTAVSADNNAALAVSGSSCLLVTANIGTTEATILETGAVAGQVLIIVNVSASNALSIKEVAGVNDQAGDATLGSYDTISYQYRGSSWVQIMKADN